jgi:hypothetical protein
MTVADVSSQSDFNFSEFWISKPRFPKTVEIGSSLIGAKHCILPFRMTVDGQWQRGVIGAVLNQRGQTYLRAIIALK